jgi:hypothetical protein
VRLPSGRFVAYQSVLAQDSVANGP